MKISAQEEYGLRCLVQLATLKDEESLTLPQIAEREGISTANAGKLLWLLNKAGFVAGDARNERRLHVGASGGRYSFE